MDEITVAKDSGPMVVYVNGIRQVLQPGETCKAEEIMIPVSSNGNQLCKFFCGPPQQSKK